MKTRKKSLSIKVLSVAIIAITLSVIVLNQIGSNSTLAYGRGRGRGAELEQNQESTVTITPIPSDQITYYSWDEIQKHNTPEDCWMVFEDKVYDVTKYLPEHDIYMDIRPWCGKDITEDFKTKAGTGEDHRPYAYRLLDNYYIGQVAGTTPMPSTTMPHEEDHEGILGFLGLKESRYGPLYTIIPFVLTLIVYTILRILKAKKKINLLQYNFILNTLLAIFGMLSAVFDFLLVAGHEHPEIYHAMDVKKAHIWVSFVFAALMLTHFIDRIKIYLAQSKSLKRKKNQVKG